jgi:hypothetical protein
MTRLRYAERALARTIDAFREFVDEPPLFATIREHERRVTIARLESKIWNGQRVYRLTCGADFGRGPHVHWVPEYILWSLIDVTRYRCPFHR